MYESTAGEASGHDPSLQSAGRGRSLVVPARRHTAEYLDVPDAHLQDLPANLRDIRRLNRCFGGTHLAVQQVNTILSVKPGTRMLDVATGSGDIPLALKRWSRRRAIPLDIVASDVSVSVLQTARKELAETDIRVVRADATCLPWQEGHFDLVVCCLALHHFSERDAVTVLQELWRVSSFAILVIDLVRSYPAWAATWLATHALPGNQLTRHDGPLSVLKAFTPWELQSMARTAGIPDARVTTHPFFRQSLVAMRGRAASYE